MKPWRIKNEGIYPTSCHLEGLCFCFPERSPLQGGGGTQMQQEWRVRNVRIARTPVGWGVLDGPSRPTYRWTDWDPPMLTCLIEQVAVVWLNPPLYSQKSERLHQSRGFFLASSSVVIYLSHDASLQLSQSSHGKIIFSSRRGWFVRSQRRPDDRCSCGPPLFWCGPAGPESVPVLSELAEPLMCRVACSQTLYSE